MTARVKKCRMGKKVTRKASSKTKEKIIPTVKVKVIVKVKVKVKVTQRKMSKRYNKGQRMSTV